MLCFISSGLFNWSIRGHSQPLSSSESLYLKFLIYSPFFKVVGILVNRNRAEEVLTLSVYKSRSVSPTQLKCVVRIVHLVSFKLGLATKKKVLFICSKF